MEVDYCPACDDGATRDLQNCTCINCGTVYPMMAVEPVRNRATGADRGLSQRMADHNAVRRAGGSPREAIRAYCAGNMWLEENARAVGNWPDDRGY